MDKDERWRRASYRYIHSQPAASLAARRLNADAQIPKMLVPPISGRKPRRRRPKTGLISLEWKVSVSIAQPVLAGVSSIALGGLDGDARTEPYRETLPLSAFEVSSSKHSVDCVVRSSRQGHASQASRQASSQGGPGCPQRRRPAGPASHAPRPCTSSHRRLILCLRPPQAMHDTLRVLLPFLTLLRAEITTIALVFFLFPPVGMQRQFQIHRAPNHAQFSSSVPVPCSPRCDVSEQQQSGARGHVRLGQPALLVAMSVA